MTAGAKDPSALQGERLGKKAAFAVAVFPPWIGKINVHCGERVC